MDLLCGEPSLGDLDGAEIQRCCLCVGASAKHNKTLWGMKQTQSDRDTKAHMLIHSVNFTLPLPHFELFYLSLLLLSKTDLYITGHSVRPIITCSST